MRLFTLWGAAALTLASACGGASRVGDEAALDRSGTVAFACYADSGPVPLAECDPEGGGSASLHVLVTQVANGEVAPISLGRSGSRVLDTDPLIPGFTFVPVGNAPSSIAVLPAAPFYTYVTNLGDSTLSVIAPANFQEEPPQDAPPVTCPTPEAGNAVRSRDMAGRWCTYRLPERSRPTDARVIASPDGQSTTLWVAFAGLQSVGRIPLVNGLPVDSDADGVLGNGPDAITLRSDFALFPPPALGAGQAISDYRVVCPASLPLRDGEIEAPRPQETIGTVPRPWVFELDEASQHLLVADAGLPLIHVIDLATATELDPLSVSVPTVDLALTPLVPADASPSSPPSVRYLYAIDAINRSVMAVDYTSGSATFGAVLPARTHRRLRGDRLLPTVAANAIAVMTPDYDPQNAFQACEPRADLTEERQSEGISPSDLRGVFLSVITTDGRVRIIDIYDRDAPCRGARECVNDDPDADPDEAVVVVRRHRPRFGTKISALGELSELPQWLRGGAGSLLGEDGAPSAGLADRLPALRPITCPDGQGPLYGSVLCTEVDPHAGVEDRFSIAYEDVVPDTAGAGGILRASGGETRLDARLDPCAVGVLGADNVPSTAPTTEPLRDYVGDQLVITSPPATGSESEDEACERERPRGSDGTATDLRIAIRETRARPATQTTGYLGSLTLGDPLNWPGGGTPSQQLARIRACWRELLVFEVRTRDAFVVSSARDGMLHRVVADDATGVCRVDSTQNARQRGRVLFEQRFESPTLAFELGPRPSALVSGTFTPPSLEVRTPDLPLVIAFDPGSRTAADLGSLTSRAVYNDLDQRLYVVEQASRGVLVMQASPFQIAEDGEGSPLIFR